MLKLCYSPATASMAPHMLLEELGVPFELVLVDKEQNAQKSTEYLKLNPHGRIPTLIDGELVLWETAAILMHLADRHIDRGLAPPIGTPARAEYYKWLVHLTNTIQPEFRVFFYVDEHTDDAGAEAGLKSKAEERLGNFFRLVDRQLADRTFILGADLSAADFFLFMLVRWGRNLSPPTRDLPNLGRHARHMLERPSVQRVFRREGITAPFI